MNGRIESGFIIEPVKAPRLGRERQDRSSHRVSVSDSTPSNPAKRATASGAAAVGGRLAAGVVLVQALAERCSPSRTNSTAAATDGRWRLVAAGEYGDRRAQRVDVLDESAASSALVTRLAGVGDRARLERVDDRAGVLGGHHGVLEDGEDGTLDEASP